MKNQREAKKRVRRWKPKEEKKPHSRRIEEELKLLNALSSKIVQLFLIMTSDIIPGTRR